MPGNVTRRSNGKWRARYRDAHDKEHARHFDRKVDAQRWLDEVTTSIVAGTYVDPAAGRITLQQFYDDWSARQLWVTKTRQNADLTVASVAFSDMPLQTIRRSHVEAWVKSASEVLAATTVKTRYVILRSVFRAAVDDRVIAHDPAVGITLPRRRRAEAALRIPTVAEVGALLAHADSGRTSTAKGSGPTSLSAPSRVFDSARPRQSRSATSTSPEGSCP